MSGGDFLPWISIGVTLLLGILVFITNRRANRTSEKKLTVEEKQAEDDRAEMIAAMTSGELKRLYTQRIPELERTVETLKTTVANLQAADVEKQKTIDDQADKLERTKGELQATNQTLSDVRALVLEFVGRVEDAWKNGHTMPTLTPEQLALLEDTIPKATYLTRRDT